MSRSYSYRAEPRALAVRQRAQQRREVEQHNLKAASTNAYASSSSSSSSSTVTTATASSSLPTRRYRPVEEEEESKQQTNIMSNPRVHRGSNFGAHPHQTTSSSSSSSSSVPLAASSANRLALTATLPNGVQTFSNLMAETRLRVAQSLASQSNGLDLTDVASLTVAQRLALMKAKALPASSAPGARKAARPITPPPVEGRQHFSAQTDPIFEDLRTKPDQNQASFTQTDADLDFDTPVLFQPRSSGLNQGTSMEPGGMPDFDRDVQCVIDSLASRTLEQALIEALEEEEAQEVARYESDVHGRLEKATAGVQHLLDGEKKYREEKERRLQQERERLAEEERQREIKRLALLALAELEDARLAAEAEARANWRDPVRQEVESIYAPALLAQTAAGIDAVSQQQGAMASILSQSVLRLRSQQDAADAARAQREFDAQVEASVQGLERPSESLLTRLLLVDAAQERFLVRVNRVRPDAASSLLEQSTARNLEVKAEAARRLAASAAALAQQELDRNNIIKIQSIARARRDRQRTRALRERRDLLEKRKSMSPEELLATLVPDLQMSLIECHAASPPVVVADSTSAISSAVSATSSSPSLSAAPVDNPLNSASATSSRPSTAAHSTTNEPSQSSSDSTTPVAVVSNEAVSSSSLRPTTASTAPALPSSSAATPSESRPTTSSSSLTTSDADPLPPQSGLLVQSVKLGGVASQAGLLKQDLLLTLDKTPLTSLPILNQLLATHRAGDALSFTVQRAETGRIDTMIVECAASEQAAYPVEKVREIRAECGSKQLKPLDTTIHTQDSAQAELEKMGVKLGFTAVKRLKNASGVLITKIVPGSLAESCGFRENDALVQVNHTPIANVEDWKEVSAKWLPGEVVKLHLELPIVEPASAATVPAAKTGEKASDKKPETRIVKKLLECGTSGKKNTPEWVRALRSIAGLPYRRVQRAPPASAPAPSSAAAAAPGASSSSTSVTAGSSSSPVTVADEPSAAPSEDIATLPAKIEQQ